MKGYPYLMTNLHPGEMNGRAFRALWRKARRTLASQAGVSSDGYGLILIAVPEPVVGSVILEIAKLMDEAE